MKSSCAVLTLIIFFSPLSFKAEEAQPRIHLPQKEHHFGNIQQGEKVTCEFPISNEGQAPLQILRIDTSCGCTAAVAGKNTLVPQEASQINVTFNSSGKQGHIQKSITVCSNDPQSPRVELIIDGDIKTLIDVVPQTLNLGPVTLGQTIERDVQVRSNIEGAPIKVIQTDKSPRIQCEMPDPVLEGNVWKSLKIKFSSAPPLGAFSEMVTLHFSDTRVSPVFLQIYGQVEGLIRAAPAQVNFMIRGNPIPTSEPQSVQLIRDDGSTFNLTNVELDPTLFNVQTFIKENGKHYEIVIRVKEGVKERFFTRVLKISTSEPSMQSIEIPVQVWLPDLPNS